MNLSEFERLSLANQYQILSKLSDDNDEKEHYEANIEILLSGYEFHYSNLVSYLATGDNIMTESESLEVLDVLSMFQAIDWAIKDGIDTSGIEEHHLKFAGFDGNHESKQLGYAQFYCRKGSGKFENIVEGKTDLNSHAPLFSRYKQMVQEWEKSQDKYKLSKEDLVRITNIYSD